jgi:hypothetical protein
MMQSIMGLPGRPMRRLRHRLAALVLASVAASPPPASASEQPRSAPACLLDEPPKVFAFDLAGRPETRLPLLSIMQDASVERPGPFRLYLRGRWSAWLKDARFGLRWAGEGGEGATGAGSSFWWGREVAPPSGVAGDPFLGWSAPPAGVGELTLAESPAHARRLARAVEPSWMARLDPTFASAVVASTGAGAFEGRGGLVSNGYDVLWSLPPLDPVIDWRCRRRPVQFIRFEGEHDRFEVVHCNGSVAREALDRFSILARPPGVPRPEGLLPDEPEPDAWAARREWVDGVRVMHPRLMWVLQQIADAYPNRAIYIISGYRRPHEDGEGSSAHRSLHHEGRAADIVVHGVDNADLFKTCRALRDVGCGYYPNSKFVHVDARHPHRGRAFWVDVSRPGDPAHYVDAWPGVVESGAMVWASPRAAESK